MLCFFIYILGYMCNVMFFNKNNNKQTPLCSTRNTNLIFNGEKKKITNKTNFYTLYAQSPDTHMRNIFICGGITAKEA